MTTLRYKLGQLLFNTADWIENLAVDVAGMREGLEDAVRETPEEAALSDHKRKLFIDGLLKRNRYPCPECEGKQYVRFEKSGFVPCPECDGTGIDRMVAQ